MTGLTLLPTTKQSRESFWAKVKKAGPDECWLWLGCCNDTGYGRHYFSDEKRQT